MKALIVVLILGIIGFIVYTQLSTPLSEEEKEVKQLEDKFNSASRQFLDAARMAGTGLDTTSDANNALNRVRKVKNELTSLKGRLEEEAAIKRAEKLEAKISAFYEKNELY